MENENRNLTRRSNHRNRKPKSRGVSTALKVVLLLLMIFATCGVTYAAKLLSEVNSTVNNAYRPRQSGDGGEVSAKNDEVDPMKDPISILIMGIDDNSERNLGSARTDSMILVTIKPDTGNVNMVSIPRDTLAMINTTEYSGYGKINSAYTYGQDEAAIQTVENLTDVPVTFYVTVDFQALVDVVDALGGIEVDVPFDIHEHYAAVENNGKLLIPAGVQNLSGEQALIFSRIRKIDNDIERGKRQMIIIQKVIEKALQVGSISKYSSVLKALNGHFWTDMTMDTMLSIAQVGLDKSLTFNSYTFAWTDGNTGSYVGLYADSLSYVSHKFRLDLGLDQADERDAEGYEFVSDYTTISAKTPIETEVPSSNSGATTVEDQDTSQAYSNTNTNTNTQGNQSNSWNNAGGTGSSSSTAPSYDSEVPQSSGETNNNGNTVPSENVNNGGENETPTSNDGVVTE